MEYSTNYIVRFEGTMTQGPNAGRTYSWADSWGGVGFADLDSAWAKLATYQALEPAISFKVFSRQWVGGRKGKWIETECQ